jgi:hypothetical protein
MVSVPVCSRVKDCERDIVKSFVTVAVMVAIDLVGVGDDVSSSESLKVDVILEFVSITVIVSVSDWRDVMVTLPVGVGGGVMVRVTVCVLDPERESSCVDDRSDAVIVLDDVNEVLAIGEDVEVGVIVRLGKLCDPDVDVFSENEILMEADGVCETENEDDLVSESTSVTEPADLDCEGVGGGVMVAVFDDVPPSMVTVSLLDSNDVTVKLILGVPVGVGGGVIVCDIVDSNERVRDSDNSFVVVIE